MIGIIDGDQEGRVDVPAAPDQIGIAIHACGEMFEHIVSLTTCSYQRVDRHDTIGPHDQRVDLGLGNHGVILQRQL